MKNELVDRINSDFEFFKSLVWEYKDLFFAEDILSKVKYEDILQISALDTVYTGSIDIFIRVRKDDYGSV